MMEILLRAGVSRWFSEELEDLTASDIALLQVVDANRDIVETACAGLIGPPAHVVVWNELHRDSFSKFLVVTSFQPVPEPCSIDTIPRQSFDPRGMRLFRKALRVRGPVQEFVLTCRPDIPSFHPLEPSRFPITPTDSINAHRLQIAS